MYQITNDISIYIYEHREANLSNPYAATKYTDILTIKFKYILSIIPLEIDHDLSPKSDATKSDFTTKNLGYYSKAALITSLLYTK